MWVKWSNGCAKPHMGSTRSHDLGLTHNDIKPANLFLNGPGRGTCRGFRGCVADTTRNEFYDSLSGDGRNHRSRGGTGLGYTSADGELRE